MKNDFWYGAVSDWTGITTADVIAEVEVSDKESVLALVTFYSNKIGDTDQPIARARLDLGKVCFIDPLPKDLENVDYTKKLVQEIDDWLVDW